MQGEIGKIVPITMMKRKTKAVCLSPTRNPTHLLAAFCNFIVVVFLFMSLDQNDSDHDGETVNFQEFLKNVMYNHTVKPGYNEKHILILTRNYSLKTDLYVMTAFDRYNFKYSVNSFVPRMELTNNKFNLIVFTSLQHYVTLSIDDRKFLDVYCKNNDIGMIMFTLYKDSQGPLTYSRLNLPINVYHIKNVEEYMVYGGTNVLRSMKPGRVREGFAIESDWAGFKFDNPSYIELARATCVDGGENGTASTHVTAFEDLGKIDGIRKVFLSHGLDFWVNNYLFMDAVHYLSNGAYSMPLKRYVSLEVDDIFRANRAEGGMNVSDFYSFVALQDNIRSSFPDFRFGLGFNGGGYVTTKDKEDEKVHSLFISYAYSFRWYDHTFHHIDIGAIENANDPVAIAEDMEQNRRFAKKFKIPVQKDYAVVKAHGGVYPVIDSLYEAFELLDVKITGADRYWIYNKYKSYIFAGFKHKGVSVIPRIEFGEITAAKSFYDEYNGGRDKIVMKVYEVFLRDFIYNYVGIYFVHYRNFAGDRIAQYVISEGLAALAKYTNLELIPMEPTGLAEKYFEAHPHHATPVWQHPCSQKYLQTLWDQSRSCTRFPHVFLIGPGSTGANILDFLFALHPKLIRNNVINTNSSNGDLQFLDVNYDMGLNWYSDHFPDIKIKAFLYEKTDSYFIGEKVPERMFALSPDAAVIVTLSDPVRRSFAAYKEEKARNAIPKGYTFYDIITSADEAPIHFRNLKDKILKAGCYVTYLKRWLEYYNAPSRIHFVDGDMLRNATAATLASVQEFLKLNPRIDYAPKITKNDGKICMKLEGTTPQPLPPGPTCLDIKKDTDEAGLSFEVREFLEDYYDKFDRQLIELLARNKRPIPTWLKKYSNAAPPGGAATPAAGAAATTQKATS